MSTFCRFVGFSVPSAFFGTEGGVILGSNGRVCLLAFALGTDWSVGAGIFFCTDCPFGTDLWNGPAGAVDDDSPMGVDSLWCLRTFNLAISTDMDFGTEANFVSFSDLTMYWEVWVESFLGLGLTVFDCGAGSSLERCRPVPRPTVETNPGQLAEVVRRSSLLLRWMGKGNG